MSLSYKIKRIRCRRFTVVEAATLAFLLATGIIAAATGLAAATGTLYEDEAVLEAIPGQCWTTGCGRAEV